MTDNAPKYVVEIVGWDGTKVRSYAGEPSIRKLDLDPDIFQITEVVGTGPSKLAISLRPEIKAALLGITDRVVATATGVALKNIDGDTVFEIGGDRGGAALSFYGETIQPIVNVGPTPTAGDIASDLAAKGLMQAS
jgi:hypothetical protein